VCGKLHVIKKYFEKSVDVTAAQENAVNLIPNGRSTPALSEQMFGMIMN
jgi:hypothetical protein